MFDLIVDILEGEVIQSNKGIYMITRENAELLASMIVDEIGRVYA